MPKFTFSFHICISIHHFQFSPNQSTVYKNELYLMVFFVKLLFISLVLVPINIFAQQQMFTNQQRFGVEEGLPQSFISGITQDKDGFIWLGTLDGLSRYDGRGFKNFRYSADDGAGISSNAVAYLLPQANNSISLLYEGYHNDEFDLRTFKVTHNNVPDILRNVSGIIWHVTSAVNTYNQKDWVFVRKNYSGIGWYNVASGKIHFANKANGLLKLDTIAALLQTPQGKIYLVSKNGVQISDPEKKSFRLIPIHTGIYTHGLQDEPLEYYGGNWVTELSEDRLAVTDYNRIVILNLRTRSVVSYDLSDPARPGLKRIARLSQTDKNGQLYFEHAGRIFRLDKTGNLKLLWQNTLAPDLRVITCYIDRTDALWVSIDAQGLLKIDLRALPFFSYHYQNNFFVDILQQTGIPKTSFPSHWLSENGSYYFRYAYDRKGNLFCSYNPSRQSGIYQWADDKFKELPKPDVEPVYTAIAVDADDGIWAFDMMKLGWFFWKTASSTPKFFPFNWKRNPINLADARFFNGNIWLSTYSQGLLQLDKKHIVHQFQGRYPRGIMPTDLTEICPDPLDKNKFWIGSRGGGLIQWDVNRGLERVFTTDDGLPNNTIYCIVPDKKGNLWCSTNKGIFRFDPITFQVYAFEKQDGLPGNEFNRAHKFIFPDGRIAFGGLDGYTIFDPADFDLKREVQAVPIQITSIQINNESQNYADDKSFIKQPLPLLNKIELPYDKNYLRFEFAAMQYNQPQKTKYRYQLEGADADWIENGNNNIAAYASLKPGNYTLLINATDNNGLWSTSIKKLEISIRPPFWATWWAYVFYGVMGLLLLRWYFIFRERVIKTQQKLVFEHREALRLREIDEMKDRFFSNVTHEFRTPLTLIISPLEKLLRDSHLPSEVVKTIEIVKRNSGQLLKLINEFLDFSKLNEGQMKVKLSTGEFRLFVTDCIRSFETAAEEKKIHLSLEIKDVDGLYFFDEDKWGKIISNLVGNALKFTPLNGEVSVSVYGKEEDICLKVTDTGPGIPLREQSKIFERFYQVNNAGLQNYAGTGIGLALVKQFTVLMNGTIRLESEPGKSTSFIIEIPVQKITGAGEEKISVNPDLVHSQKEVQEGSPLLLVAEDNDELRSFLVESLSQYYHVIETGNGTEAWEMILSELPDVVISDVMMPGRDGFEICRLCKTDNRTAHIGFILLTSKAGQISRISGLETGADVYLTKPFHLDELELHITNLLHAQEKIQSHLRQKLLDLQPMAKQVPVENPFLEQLFLEMDSKLDDPQLGVDYLCKAMGMSRSTLNRKLKSLLNISTNDLIRQHRLQKATHYLSEGLNIASASFKVGFSSPSYFTQCFREQYGITPSDYVLRQN